MKLLFDENLSRKLAIRLSDLFPESRHAVTEGLLHSPDRSIWEYAGANEFTIVTADSDFYELAVTYGPPPKVIWLKGCDYPTAIAERLLRDQAIRVTEFIRDSERSVLILTP